jgi:hypothetical protein
MAGPIENCNRYQRSSNVTASGTGNDGTSALSRPTDRRSMRMLGIWTCSGARRRVARRQRRQRTGHGRSQAFDAIGVREDRRKHAQLIARSAAKLIEEQTWRRRRRTSSQIQAWPDQRPAMPLVSHVKCLGMCLASYPVAQAISP